MEEIIWSKRAINDVQIIYQYISSDSIFYANKWLDHLAERTSILPAQPFIGRAIPERSDQNLREIIYGEYRVMYKIVKKQIVIYRIMHVARSFK